ncbi:cytochrome P450 [Kineosporia succinea]|uniref:Cytochrome P450 n=1 Tax=Kineosporia succinea TaxID=84632 RepID=A0ABT9PAF8_9ACTN|nr:cytochrome P450 [Kineosporia succinea]MDP9829660.1 cytochrome P450 [Kineosporia succinea]
MDGEPGRRPPEIDVDPFDERVLADPYPLDATIRDTAAVVRLRAHDVYGIARYQDVRAALQDWQTFRSGAGAGLVDFWAREPRRPLSVVLEADPPWHDAPRRILEDLLGPSTQRRMREEWTRAADELVDRVLPPGSGESREFDGFGDLARTFPLNVMGTALGIPEEGREHILEFSDFLLNGFGPRNELARAGRNQAPWLAEWVARNCERDVFTRGSLGDQIWSAADRRQILPAQALGLVRSIFAAGFNTTVHSLAAALHAFSTEPRQWELLRDDPALLRHAFDEVLRWASPIQTFFRTTAAPAVIDGLTIPPGSKVLLFLGAANRDPRRWKDPERFDLTRDPSGHLGFGFGVHQCVGQHLARLEAECLLAALRRRVRRLEPAGPPRRRLNNTVRAWESLPLRAELVSGVRTSAPGPG